MSEFEKWWDEVGKYSNGDTYSQSKFTFEAGAAMQREKDAKICDKWIDVNHVYTNGAIRCAEDIRNQS